MDFENHKETYLAVMMDSLQKKCELLEQLIELSKQQELVIRNEKIDDDQFDLILKEKDLRIEKILKLDEGFDKIYQYLKQELAENRGKYQIEIQKMKDLISFITDKGVQLQVIEKQNKTRMDAYFSVKRKEIKDFKISSQTASSYYKNMADQHQQQSYFFDKKN